MAKQQQGFSLADLDRRGTMKKEPSNVGGNAFLGEFAMADDDSKQSSDAKAKLATLCKRETELRATYDDNIWFLREMAGCSICSTEEQQRIVGDINDIRKQLIHVEKEIWKLKYWS